MADKKRKGTNGDDDFSSTKANEIFTLGKGDDVISYDFSTKHGKDTINLTKGETLTLDFSNDEDLTYKYSKKGNDAIIKAVKINESNPYNVKAVCSVSSSLKNGYYTLSIKGYEMDEETHKYSSNFQKLKGYCTKNQLNEYGLKAGSTATLYLEINTSLDSLIEEGGTIDITEYIDSFTKTAPKTVETYGQITLKNYFKLKDKDMVLLGSENLSDIMTDYLNETYVAPEYPTKKRTIKDTFLDESIYGSSKGDTIYSLGGDDYIEMPKGNLTIKNGSKSLYNYAESGKITVAMDKSAKLEIKTDFEIDSFEKSGNNLIINENLENGKKIIINNYFKNPDNYSVSFTDGYVLEDLTTSFKSSNEDDMEYISMDYSKSKTTSITGTNLNDNILAGSKIRKVNAGEGNNTIYFSGENLSKPVNINAGKGNDAYTINTMKVSHNILDKGGEDELIIGGESIYSSDDFIFLFDVLKEGAKASKKNDLATLHIICKENYGNDMELSDIASKIAKTKKLYNTVNIQNYFKKDGTEGSGCIETISFAGNSNLDMDFDAIRENVASFLSGTKYNSAMDALQRGNSETIENLLQIYMGE